MTLEEIVNNLKSAGQDYGQLFNNNPRMDSFASVLQKGVGQLIPSNADFKSPEAMRDWGTAAALNAPMGLTFTGPKSMGWDATKAAEAEKLLNAGADPAQVWKDHLIGRMPDKSLFSEIDDSKQATQGLNMLTRALEPDAIAQGAPRTMPQWVWMDHPELFKNYPETSSIMVNPTSSIESQGSYDPLSKILNLSAFSSNPKSTTLHELQHAIQEKEGWARGGNPGMFDQQKEAELARDALSWRRELLNKRKEMPKADWYHVDNELVQDYQKQGIFDWVPNREARDLASQPYILHADKYDNGAGLKDLEDLVKMYGLDKNTSPYKPMDGYRRLTGEAQARATQDRMNMGMQQRRDTYPLAGDKLSDIPLDQLINRYR
jgi:hypothetical protein